MSWTFFSNSRNFLKDPFWAVSAERGAGRSLTHQDETSTLGIFETLDAHVDVTLEAWGCRADAISCNL